MKLFNCPTCQSVVYFDSMHCEMCATALAYMSSSDAMVDADGVRLCANATTIERCNWSAYDDGWCASCVLDTDHSASLHRRAFQLAKKRTLRQLNALHVPFAGVDPPLGFELSEGTVNNPVTIGHADGLITLDVAEADPAHLAEVRATLGERYRTPLGHVRHELGHWYWAANVGVRFSADGFRRLFGDETIPYSEALAQHYAGGDDGVWRSTHISHYAASHPWEDFAESFAHVLHILDTVETAAARGVIADFDVHTADFHHLYDEWVELSQTLNDLNRSMGTPDPYPFVVSAPAVEKLRFVHASVV